MSSHYQTSPCVHGLWNCACGVPGSLGYQSASADGRPPWGVLNPPGRRGHWSATTAAGQAQYPPLPPPAPQSPAAASLARKYKANMKELTCWFWYHQGNCRRSDEDCLYSHRYLGPDKIADKPVLREPGKPAVAGNNALKDSPEYRDWSEIHGRPKTTSPKWETPFVVPYTGDLFKERKAEEEDPAAVTRESDDTNRPFPQEQSVSGILARRKRSHPEEPTFIIPGSNNMPSSSSQTGKAPKLAADPTSPTTETTKPANPTEAENRALKETVQQMSGIISGLINDSATTRANGDPHLNAMLSGVYNLPEPYRGNLLPPLSGCADAMTKSHIDAENKARESMEEVSGKLGSIGQGGLVKGWDRGFAHLPMRRPGQG